ncbi:hypothetical protein BRARA_B01526 [Brassica rapa]|uniref:Uncharacterized protein n=1 Tax=Brassica campestris TaxID=3711 RepID=A0A398AGL2_BRACM|nr:hypothetical protein BRARA_B01526 [Brassica rapa]
MKFRSVGGSALDSGLETCVGAGRVWSVLWLGFVIMLADVLSSVLNGFCVESVDTWYASVVPDQWVD